MEHVTVHLNMCATLFRLLSARALTTAPPLPARRLLVCVRVLVCACVQQAGGGGMLLQEEEISPEAVAALLAKTRCAST
jgi:hypothetical protein